MTVLVLLETVLLVVLSVLVAGLLRGYASVLRRLHELEPGRLEANGFRLDEPPAARLADPTPRADWTEAHDLAGESLRGELVATRVTGVEHDTVLLFLSSGCSSCAVFWDELASAAPLPGDTRLIVVAQGDEAEDPAVLQRLAAPHLDVIRSSQAWRDYEVPGSPHVVFVDGRSGRVRGEGTGQSWTQVRSLLDRSAPPDRDGRAEADVDRELLAAGILPGDPQLYGDS